MADNQLPGTNSCYTYFSITGDFDPDVVTRMLGLTPSEFWRIGDLRRNGTVFDFAAWSYGKCRDYDVYVENQMMKTLEDLIPRIDVLQQIRQMYDVSFTLEVVPSVHVDGVAPCLAPNRAVIEFCYHTHTDIDIDLYVLADE